MIDFFQSYFSALASTPLDEITEHTHRGALEDLINQIANTNQNNVTIIHEPTNQQGLGRPDFLVKSKASQSILGYIENKKIGENLIDITKTDQIIKYRKLCENILLTNYTEWIWICGDNTQSAIFCNVTDLKNPKNNLNPDNIERVVALVSGFLSQPPTGISNIKTLANVLAIRADLLEDLLREAFVDKGLDQDPKLAEIYGLLKASIDHTLTEQKFIDIFVQTLTYGLFLAKLTNKTASIDLTNARKYVSESFPVIKYLVGFLDVLDGHKYGATKWIFEEILAILDTASREGITESLKFAYGVKKEDNLFEDGYLIKDPYVHFYEDFLTKYNNKLKFETGSFYTPLPVVDFIVRAVDRALSEKLGITKGLADKDKVTVLDFAAGTGTFLYEAINFVLKKTTQKKPAFVRETIEKHIIPNFHGLELMMAPYTIAHLKITGLLGEYKYYLKPDERLKIYLTNTLDFHDEATTGMFPTEMAQENVEANIVKTQPILAIIGNPPYSGKTSNPGLYEDNINGTGVYKYINGVPLKDKNSKWLNDDYVKFIRFAEKKIEGLEEGVVAIITNHGFLDNRTFRGMRNHLMKTFDQMYFIDLHGSTNKKEKSPDGSPDVNVFDIKAGVAISLFIKNKKLKKKVYTYDLYGTRKSKYQWLTDNNIDTIDRNTIDLSSDLYLFQKIDETMRNKYNKGIKLNDIFENNSIGIGTYDDKFLVGFSNNDLISKVSQKYGENDPSKIKKYSYRAFDNRKTYYDLKLQKRPRYNLMKHILLGDNLLINLSKNVSYKKLFNSVMVSEHLTDLNLFGGGSYSFPLFLYSDDGKERRLNIKPNAIQQFIDKYSLEEDIEEVGTQIMNYIYAILYSPSYREQFSQFLKSDFPCIPLIDSKDVFKKLVKLGGELIDLHLLRNLSELEELGTYPIVGDNIIDKKIRRINGKLYINNIQYFDNVSKEIWEFTIGGYQVLDKWLKYREDCILSMDDVEHLQKVMSAIHKTYIIMKKINEIVKF